jgi:hypothetical protein
VSQRAIKVKIKIWLILQVKVTIWRCLSQRVTKMKMAGVAGLEPVTSAVTGQRSNQLSYTPAWGRETLKNFLPNVKVWLEKFSGGLKF